MFLFKQKTAYDMRISDWSSDVCSSDLRMNRELDGDIPVDGFRHEVRWHTDHNRIEMHLRAERNMRFHVAGEAFGIAEGETIHTENSHNYNVDEARLLLRAGGWTDRKSGG